MEKLTLDEAYEKFKEIGLELDGQAIMAMTNNGMNQTRVAMAVTSDDYERVRSVMFLYTDITKAVCAELMKIGLSSESAKTLIKAAVELQLASMDDEKAMNDRHEDPA